MKKIKLLSAFMAILLCFSMLLTACGKKDGEEESNDETQDETEAVVQENEGDASKSESVTYKLVDVINKDWTYTKKGVISSYTATEFLGDSFLAENGFMATEDEDGEGNEVIRVYNMVKEKLLLTMTSSQTQEDKEDNTLRDRVNTIVTEKNSYVNIISSGYVAVLSVTTVDDEHGQLERVGSSTDFKCNLYGFADGDTDSCYAKYSFVIYDAEGKAVRTVSEKELETRCSHNAAEIPEVYAGIAKDYEDVSGSIFADLVIDGTKAYRMDKSGNKTLVKDFGLSKMPEFEEETFSRVGEKYLEKYGYTYVVYDKSLNVEYKYTVPSYASVTCANLLANGSLLVQYSVTLNQYDAGFDYKSGSTGKFALKTFLVSKDGAAELEDINYVIRGVRASAVNIDGGNKMYSEKIENLALIFPISEDKLCDLSNANIKLVALSNDCKTVIDIISDEKIVDFPKWINEDVFAVSVEGGGLALYSDNGERISEINNIDTDSLYDRKYAVADDGIYNLKGAKIYDFKENNVVFFETCGSSLLIGTLSYDKNGAEQYNYSILTNGELKAVAGEVISCHSRGYYVVKNTNENKDGDPIINYSYYNDKGAAIGTFTDELEHLYDSTDFIILKSDAENKIYKFAVTAEAAK